uniref:Thioredoxin-related transmembrane protein 2 homolog n=1 Tax=Crassostrea virginica TaxID=6565 RepID=A0A8B8ETQ3_CRAVI|nr:thioredoxin-related transmembrane protein 2 homolog [Crassostrea virginica]
MSKLIAEIKDVLSLHLVTNILLAISYYILKVNRPICEYLFDDCFLELKEWEWLTFLGCIIVIKCRKQGTFLEYMSTACMFAKFLNAVMMFKASPIYGFVYVLILILHTVVLPRPVYQGPEYVTYFRGPHLQEELERDKRITWIITFYAAWSPQSVTFAPIFSEISSQYHLDNLKFGKIDVSRYPDVGKKYNVDSGSWSKQLPTVIVFENGKETNRKPFISPKGTVVRYKFSKDGVISDFDLNNIYHRCKQNPLKGHKAKTDDEIAKEKKEN